MFWDSFHRLKFMVSEAFSTALKWNICTLGGGKLQNNTISVKIQLCVHLTLGQHGG